MNQPFYIDRIVWSNRWRNRHGAAKIGFAATGMALGLLLPPFPFLLLEIVSLILFLLISGVRPLQLLRMLLLPLGFIAAAVLPLIFEFNVQSSWGWIGIQAGALGHALEVVSRAIATLLALYSLVLTTPSGRVLAWLTRMGLSAVLVDLLYFSYRMIYIFFDSIARTAHAQRSRVGRSNLRQTLYLRSLLFYRLHHRIIDRVERMERGLYSRGYRDRVEFAIAEEPLNPMRLFGLALFHLVPLALGLLFGIVGSIDWWG